MHAEVRRRLFYFLRITAYSLIREILKKVMRRQKRTGGSTTHVPNTIKEYAVILKKEKSFFALPHAREFGSARNMDDSWRMK